MFDPCSLLSLSFAPVFAWHIEPKIDVQLLFVLLCSGSRSKDSNVLIGLVPDTPADLIDVLTMMAWSASIGWGRPLCSPSLGRIPLAGALTGSCHLAGALTGSCHLVAQADSDLMGLARAFGNLGLLPDSHPKTDLRPIRTPEGRRYKLVRLGALQEPLGTAAGPTVPNRRLTWVRSRR